MSNGLFPISPGEPGYDDYIAARTRAVEAHQHWAMERELADCTDPYCDHNWVPVAMSDEQITAIRERVERHRAFWPTEADMDEAFDISARLTAQARARGDEGRCDLPPFTPEELRDICRDVFVLRDILAAVERHHAAMKA